MIRQYELVERVRAYDPSADEDLLNKAYVFSMKAHGTQTRASGDPYFSHPLEVAGILTQLKLDAGTIATALLHDTVEDTVATLEDIERLFGKDIARLVDGVTKLSRLEMHSEQTKQAENFRKLVLAMSEDIRVLLVKLADRLHNMRTLHHLKNPDKRKRIARETLEIYAPLAERIGMHQVKDELEDLAFAQLNPDARDSILAQLARLRTEGQSQIQRIIGELKQTLAAEGLPDAQVTGREKSAYSIWRKLQMKNVSFEQLSDIMAFRIIVDSLPSCYMALGLIHAKYPVVPGRFKDYISTPKPNGYKSLHTGVIGPERNRIEVQIRTRDMHEIAELGVAAHWAYKQDPQAVAKGREYRWLRELLDILEHAQKPEEFLEHTKLELFQDQVFCFTPKGDLIALPRGATPVDFAYAVHSEVGDHCVGAKINGRMLPLRTQLQNGDQVEVITSKAQSPVPGWERFVVTGKARARIRKFLRTQQRSQYIELGRAILQRQFKAEGYEFSDKALDGVIKIFQQPSADDLLAAVGSGLHSGREVFHAVFPGHKAQTTPKEADGTVTVKTRPKPKGRESALPIRGLIPGMAVHYARCCHPLPGDRIVGIVTTGKGVTIHTIDCETLESFHESPERWIDVAWDVGPDTPEDHVGRISLVVANEPGSLGTLSTVIGKNGGNITNLKITSRNQDFFELLIDIDVKDAKHLTNIIAALRATPAINSVDRSRGR
ncbi:bifunctional (p)ppGpp synthetase/guanosine-3',5'-bis(diphosphate) 3'-pyrophosphohydrolase [Azospirillum sp. RWY-5-1]|uniref:GTP pyrophosphokinase rsh n=1 Tax=Azospirillum oleiclasticum TaxID=2735135 RepID=A0ABX2TER3_9PROT|nr:bifunctional (p)ppGpp synthetase/guanosine-3',5'-bis(diphosphate) 3'-pyrophosphohydrolase [Azospirillum oleiclasticum]NYZ15068.1 bifunctional (p)ppGpp synthetase/guanosine-3',5'-bis(diphosphate) 3'-pyrophosphohydrolase [Azospirillum oleiclasticum]NYZ22830.1 bifunctional (p)ppGpp synthetase/guanosine-3',5'-bis(diphosphate) 3'-pyrophosphohydrolase [Azospirillum oleiclasticum]